MEKITLNEKARMQGSLKNLLTYIGLIFLATVGFSLVMITGVVEVKSWIGYIILGVGLFITVPALVVTYIVLVKINKDILQERDLKAFKIISWMSLNRWMLKVSKKLENNIEK